MKSTPDLSTELILQENYRNFLVKFIELMSQKKSINFSQLSRQAGFSSRSFIKEVITGKKRLTMSSMTKLKKALGLTAGLANYFEALVALEEEGVNIQNFSLEVRQKKILKIRKKLLDSINNKKIAHKEAETIFLNRYAPDVYAALGAPESGATLDEITQKNGLSQSQVLSVLQYFLDLKIISKTKNRYFLNQNNLDIFAQGKNLNFQNIYIQSLRTLADEARYQFDSSDKLFLHSTFSISKEKLPALKEKMQKIIIELLDEEQIDTGSTVAHVTLGLY